MQLTKMYSGTPEAIAIHIIADKDMEPYPFRAALAVQVERMCSSYPLDEWRCHVVLDYSVSPGDSAITVKQEVTIALA